MFNHIGRLCNQIKVKNQDSKAVAEEQFYENKALQAALNAYKTKQKAVEAAMAAKEEEFNKSASIRALVARMSAKADATARGITPIASMAEKPGQTDPASRGAGTRANLGAVARPASISL